ncbi:MAG: hypothetical protein KBA51_04130 [Kiritimatiellae bacterium]|nr:hypothetical protein [Kiritimatiellia bacterium]
MLLDRQRKENEAMYKEIAALPLPQKIENLRAHRERQIGENEAFVRKQHRENIAFVKNSDAWPKERKAEIIANLHARHRTAEVFWTGLRKENRAFFTRLASHPEMAPERTTNAIRTFQQAQREKIQAWRKQNRPGIPLGDEPQRRRKRPGAKSDAPAEAKPRAKATL